MVDQSNITWDLMAAAIAENVVIHCIVLEKCFESTYPAILTGDLAL